MRSKEDAQDYRYFPEPDLVPIIISDEWIEEIRSRQPELRTEKLERYKTEYDIPQYDAEILTSHKKLADIFEATVALGKKPKEVSNWLMVETMRLLKEHDLEPSDLTFAPENLAKLIDLIEKGAINRTTAKEVFEKVFAENADPEVYVEENLSSIPYFDSMESLGRNAGLRSSLHHHSIEFAELIEIRNIHTSVIALQSRKDCILCQTCLLNFCHINFNHILRETRVES